MKVTKRSALAWLENHPWVLAAFGIGALVGILLCLPLVPFELPDSAATIISSALGAIAAVGGALWLQLATEQRKERDARVRTWMHISATVEWMLKEKVRLEASPAADMQQWIREERGVFDAIKLRVDHLVQWVTYGHVADLDVVDNIQKFGATVVFMLGRLKEAEENLRTHSHTAEDEKKIFLHAMTLAIEEGQKKIQRLTNPARLESLTAKN